MDYKEGERRGMKQKIDTTDLSLSFDDLRTELSIVLPITRFIATFEDHWSLCGDFMTRMPNFTLHNSLSQRLKRKIHNSHYSHLRNLDEKIYICMIIINFLFLC